MTEVKPSPKGQKTRGRLLEAAIEELIANDGNLEFAAVAQRAQLSAGAPYRHFASKSHLLIALVDAFYDEWEALAYRPSLEEVSDDWWEREQERIRLTVEFHYRHPLGALMQQRMLGDALAIRHQRLRSDDLVRGAIKNLRRGQKLGRIAKEIDAELCGALLMGGVGQCLHQALGHKKRLSEKRVVRQMQAFMQRVLCIEE